MKNCIAACLTLLPVSLSVSPVMAADKDKQFFQTIEGQWSGPGEIVAGKYKGTKFVCNLAGTTPDDTVGMTLDVTSGSVNGNKVVFGLNRKQLNGAMLARVSDPNTMNVTVSVRVEKELVPVIGMSLKRVDTIAVGSIAKN
ncbi:hypothetical protein [Brucella sp. 63/311]|uniref:hypothetical protein n=1 Tax=Brucella sp. 63/311 TaxID=1160235 RepID=UPI0002CDEFAF|nr:hypothetical protein [Brucella sp. 63/311]ENT05568.1 hypothetical protein C038_00954 [Brucella sp. 63/311]